ncbi:MAG TPA: glycosyltransferase family 2 protein [Solirubrobacteraceae bacterium]|jgi:glycosyltransferase involved in cell wall biosynthesis|nr:glycosyltransferase family 2 protein [Solirubrobacteraceae bacterium]
MPLTVVLPVLNEAEALPWVLSRIPPAYMPLVVDNGSTDGSAQIAAALGAHVVHEAQSGFGAACFAGLLAAADGVVCFMDCDASLDPRDLPLVADPVARGTRDLMLGARQAEPGAMTAHQRLANRALTHELRRRSGLRLRDLGPMRAARRGPLLELAISDRRFGWPLEMVLLAASAGWRIGEVGVPYRARAGRSKVTGTVRGTIRVVRDMAGVLAAAQDRAITPGGARP